MNIFKRRSPEKEIKKQAPFSPKLRISDNLEVQKLSRLLRIKIKKAFDVKYEFTLQELKQEFEQGKFPKLLKSKIFKMLVLFESIQYMGKELTEKKEAEVLKELEELMNQLNKRIQKKK